MSIEDLDDIKVMFLSYHEDDCTTNSRFGIGCSCRFGILLDEIIDAFPMSDPSARMNP
jgi:hypothetical protein